MAATGVEEHAYPRGRYNTWLIVVTDEWRTRSDGKRVYRCRSCPEWCENPRARWCSDPCRKIWSELVERPLNANTLRHNAIARDGRSCVECGIQERTDIDGPNTYLEVDHILPVVVYPELEFDLDNTRTLCTRCHARIGARPGTPQAKAARAPGQTRVIA